MTAVLDTHVVLWWLAGDRRLPRSFRRVLESANADSPLVISDITLWEIATLHEAAGRIGRVLSRP